MADIEEVAPEPPPVLQQLDLHPCGICGRTFVSKALTKHEQICQKQAAKKRKPFNSLAQRVAGTDLADFHMKTYLKKSGNENGDNTETIDNDLIIPDIPLKIETNPSKTDEPEMMKPNNRRGREKVEKITVTHSKLEKSISKPPIIEETPLKGSQNTITPKRSTSTLRTAVNALAAQGEKCPSCDRTFGAKAFERHVEWCKERNNLNRAQPSPAALQMAKERLAARTNYRAPPLLAKSQRQINKEKYSQRSSKQNSSEDEYGGSLTVQSPSSLTRSPSIRKESISSTISSTNITNGLKRGNSMRRPSPQSIHRKPESPGHYDGGDNSESNKHGRQKKLSRGKSPPVVSTHDLVEEKTPPYEQRHHDLEVTPPIMSMATNKKPTTSFKKPQTVLNPVTKSKLNNTKVNSGVMGMTVKSFKDPESTEVIHDHQPIVQKASVLPKTLKKPGGSLKAPSVISSQSKMCTKNFIKENAIKSKTNTNTATHKLGTFTKKYITQKEAINSELEKRLSSISTKPRIPVFQYRKKSEIPVRLEKSLTSVLKETEKKYLEQNDSSENELPTIDLEILPKLTKINPTKYNLDDQTILKDEYDDLLPDESSSTFDVFVKEPSPEICPNFDRTNYDFEEIDGRVTLKSKNIDLNNTFTLSTNTTSNSNGLDSLDSCVENSFENDIPPIESNLDVKTSSDTFNVVSNVNSPEDYVEPIDNEVQRKFHKYLDITSQSFDSNTTIDHSSVISSTVFNIDSTTSFNVEKHNLEKSSNGNLSEVISKKCAPFTMASFGTNSKSVENSSNMFSQPDISSISFNFSPDKKKSNTPPVFNPEQFKKSKFCKTPEKFTSTPIRDVSSCKRSSTDSLVVVPCKRRKLVDELVYQQSFAQDPNEIITLFDSSCTITDSKTSFDEYSSESVPVTAENESRNVETLSPRVQEIYQTIVNEVGGDESTLEQQLNRLQEKLAQIDSESGCSSSEQQFGIENEKCVENSSGKASVVEDSEEQAKREKENQTYQIGVPEENYYIVEEIDSSDSESNLIYTKGAWELEQSYKDNMNHSRPLSSTGSIHIEEITTDNEENFLSRTDEEENSKRGLTTKPSYYNVNYFRNQNESEELTIEAYSEQNWQQCVSINATTTTSSERKNPSDEENLRKNEKLVDYMWHQKKNRQLRKEKMKSAELLKRERDFINLRPNSEIISSSSRKCKCKNKTTCYECLKQAEYYLTFKNLKISQTPEIHNRNEANFSIDDVPIVSKYTKNHHRNEITTSRNDPGSKNHIGLDVKNLKISQKPEDRNQNEVNFSIDDVPIVSKYTKSHYTNEVTSINDPYYKQNTEQDISGNTDDPKSFQSREYSYNSKNDSCSKEYTTQDISSHIDNTDDPESFQLQGCSNPSKREQNNTFEMITPSIDDIPIITKYTKHSVPKITPTNSTYGFTDQNISSNCIENADESFQQEIDVNIQNCSDTGEEIQQLYDQTYDVNNIFSLPGNFKDPKYKIRSKKKRKKLKSSPIIIMVDKTSADSPEIKRNVIQLEQLNIDPIVKLNKLIAKTPKLKKNVIKLPSLDKTSIDITLHPPPAVTETFNPISRSGLLPPMIVESNNTESYDPFLSAERQMQELLTLETKSTPTTLPTTPQLVTPKSRPKTAPSKYILDNNSDKKLSKQTSDTNLTTILPDINAKRKVSIVKTTPTSRRSSDQHPLIKAPIIENFPVDEIPIVTKYTKNHLVPGIDDESKVMPKQNYPLISLNNREKIKNIKNRASVIEPPTDFQDFLANKSIDNFEIIENIINQNTALTTNSKIEHKNSINLNKILFTDSMISDDTFEINPDLINSIDNLSIPEELKTVDDHYSTEYDKQMSTLEQTVVPTDNNRVVENIKNDNDSVFDFDSFISSFDDDNDDEILPSLKIFLRQSSVPTSSNLISSSVSPNQNNNNPSIKSPTSYLKRSVSVTDPVAKPKNLKNKGDVEKFFHGQEDKKHAQKNQCAEDFTAEDLFDVDDELYQEYKQYEEMYLKEKQRKTSGREPLSGVMGPYGEKTMRDKSQSPENNKCDTKPSADSAYSSLNRSTTSKEYPKRGGGNGDHEQRRKKTSIAEDEQQRSSSSTSGSDVSIPVVSRSKKKSTAIHRSLLNSVANPQFESNEFNTQINDHRIDRVNYTIGRRKNSADTTQVDDDSETSVTAHYRNSPEHRKSSDSLHNDGEFSSKHDVTSLENLTEAIDEQHRKTSIEGQQRLPKFCHECGSKYPVSVAKFCVECGAKRLVL